MTCGEDATEGGKRGEIDVLEEGRIGNKEDGFGIFKLVADFALAV